MGVAPDLGLMHQFDRETRAGADAPESRNEYQRQIFRDMLNRNVFVFNPRKFVRSEESHESSATWKGPIRIACISSALEIWAGVDLAFSEFRDGCHLLKERDRPTRLKRWREQRLAELADALLQDPHVICLPEFAYPPPAAASNTAGGWTIEEINLAVSQRNAFESQALQMVREWHAKKPLGTPLPFVFLGSYHCLMTLYNVGVIYPWGGDDGSVTYTDYTTQKRDGIGRRERKVATSDHKGPVLYRKRFPARKLDEGTRVPNGRDFNVFERPFGRLGLVICSDLLDLNQFSNLIRESVDFHSGFEFILVPTYSPQGKGSFSAISRDLSFMSSAAVVITGAEDEGNEDGMTSTDIYFKGKSVRQSQEDFKDIFKVTDFKAGDSKATLFEVLDAEVFRNARQAHLFELVGEQPANRIQRNAVG